MSVSSAYCLWLLIMSRLDTLQQCISVDVRWKQFPSTCRPAPLRGSKFAKITPDATIAIVVTVKAITYDNNCVFKITSS